MGFQKYDQITSQRYTSSAITATGATTLVASVGAGISLLVDQLRVVSLTATTSPVEVSFGDTTTAGHWFGAGTGVGEIVNIDFSEPWRLETNSALIFVSSVGAASTPTLRVSVKTRAITRGV